MNIVILCGRLTRDVETRYTQGAEPMAISRFTLAVDRRRKNSEEASADFINVVSFGKKAEFAEKYLIKGTKVLITGRWQTGSYTNNEGVKVYTNDCIADDIEFAESKRAQEGTPTTKTPASDEFMNIPDGLVDELPFN